MRIRWTEPAARDLTSICDYIKEHDGPEAARKVALRIYEGIGKLAPFPHLGRPGRKLDTREMVFPNLPFLVVYSVRADAIEINRILHGRRSGLECRAKFTDALTGPRRLGSGSSSYSST